MQFVALSLEYFALLACGRQCVCERDQGGQMRTGASKIHLSVKFQSHLPDAVLPMQRTYFNELSFTF